MNIKIKYIKNTLLILACLFFALVNYFSYVVAADDYAKLVCNVSIDSDCDELTNDEELAYGTNKNERDTDGDGYSDGVEIKSGYNPLLPSPGDKIIQNSTDSKKFVNANSDPSMTDEFTDKLTQLVEKKGSTSVAVSDVQALLDQMVIEQSGIISDWSSLPEVNKNEFKVIDQTYPGLSAEQKKEKIKKDAINYIIKVSYLLAANSPSLLSDNDDVKAASEELLMNISSLSSSNPNFTYLQELAKRSGRFAEEVKATEVPQSMVDLHTKVIRWSLGVSLLENIMPKNGNDPVQNIVVISKISNLSLMLVEFFEKDLQDYINSIN